LICFFFFSTVVKLFLFEVSQKIDKFKDFALKNKIIFLSDCPQIKLLYLMLCFSYQQQQQQQQQKKTYSFAIHKKRIKQNFEEKA
jgi:hypothetical protein